MIGLLGAILKSRTATALLAAAGVLVALLAWHKLDKGSAVRQAVVGYVARVELTSARVELAEIRRRQAVADAARRHLQSQIERAEAQAEAAAEELEHYVSQVDEGCIVQPGLVERLRND